MAYQRFLTDNDYASVVTEEHLKQIIRDNSERIPQAEQRAEMNMLEYLDQYYEIEKILAIGKNIRQYSSYITYPANVWIKVEGKIYKTLKSINGLKKPVATPYWRHITEFINPMIVDNSTKYSQLKMYAKGDVVYFGTEYWECLVPHGYEASEIHIPGVNAWKEVEFADWEPYMPWELNQVCKYNDNFYQYISNSEDESIDESVITPEEDERWGQIGEYSDSLEYSWSEDDYDYVAYQGKVFRPTLNPNADAIMDGINITRDDPRNINIVTHMSRIALYYLHQTISPTNISETRRWAFEDSMTWLYNASKFKINPQLPRKTERDSNQPKVDWALATFQKDYNPDENAWLI